MTIGVTIVGATGWVGRSLVGAVAAAPDLRLAGAVARGAAGQDVGSATGGDALGVTIVATLAEALRAPGEVVVDYTTPEAVKAHTLAAI
ncbi:MAG: 4-hydroxy-tetrahydrodipicolinate reductase, partial [Hyphomicrobiales bacterium]|nr:4-hydroxy-tetrahydrodipicolinate reductase [Hyphomicrobiales bacterium]